MTYLSFHLIFTVPAIVVLIVVLLSWRGKKWLLNKMRSIGILAVIAVAYTTPWDNYLVFKEVWSYGPERVLGTIGFVPIEEYAFFILQTVLTGLLLQLVTEWRGSDNRKTIRPSHRIGVAILLVIVFAVGIYGLGRSSSFYFGLILSWAAPVLLLQWLLGAAPISKRLWHWLPTVTVSTVFLAAADRIAIAEGTWSISEQYTTGWNVFGLPLEEAVFFLVTNLLVVWGILLFDDFEDRRRLRN